MNTRPKEISAPFLTRGCKKVTCVMRRALAVVGVHAIHTHSAVLAAVARTVVNIVLTVLTGEACPTKEKKRLKPCLLELMLRLSSPLLSPGTWLAVDKISVFSWQIVLILCE